LATIPQIFEAMPDRYLCDVLDAPRSWYFSVGEHKYTVLMTPETCDVAAGKTQEQCDYVLKIHPKLFEKLVLRGGVPTPIDIARGRIKTNDSAALVQLRQLFRFDP
jgi:hypothetical protein